MRQSSYYKPKSVAGLSRTAEEVAQDNKLVGFGQYKNLTWNDVAEKNPSYIVWCHEKVTNKPLCSLALAKFCGYVPPAVGFVPQSDDKLPKGFNDGDDFVDDDIPF